MSDTQAREVFEKWCKHKPIPVCTDKTNKGVYLYLDVTLAWEAWLAAHSAGRKAGIEAGARSVMRECGYTGDINFRECIGDIKWLDAPEQKEQRDALLITKPGEKA